jgi:hypothetical protein
VSENILRKIYLLPKAKSILPSLSRVPNLQRFIKMKKVQKKPKFQSINHTKHLKLNYEINGQHTYNMTKKAGLDDWFELFL